MTDVDYKAFFLSIATPFTTSTRTITSPFSSRPSTVPRFKFSYSTYSRMIKNMVLTPELRKKTPPTVFIVILHLPYNSADLVQDQLWRRNQYLWRASATTVLRVCSWMALIAWVHSFPAICDSPRGRRCSKLCSGISFAMASRTSVRPVVGWECVWSIWRFLRHRRNDKRKTFGYAIRLLNPPSCRAGSFLLKIHSFAMSRWKLCIKILKSTESTVCWARHRVCTH